VSTLLKETRGTESVPLRPTEDQLPSKVIHGGGNMAAYRNSLSPADAKALVTFLWTLHPANQATARNASQGVAPSMNRSEAEVL
jgi:ubiquinol-cytochrome c reductase cytochrome b subunit